MPRPKLNKQQQEELNHPEFDLTDLSGMLTELGAQSTKLRDIVLEVDRVLSIPGVTAKLVAERLASTDSNIPVDKSSISKYRTIAQAYGHIPAENWGGFGLSWTSLYTTAAHVKKTSEDAQEWFNLARTTTAAELRKAMHSDAKEKGQDPYEFVSIPSSVRERINAGRARIAEFENSVPSSTHWHIFVCTQIEDMTQEELELRWKKFLGELKPEDITGIAKKIDEGKLTKAPKLENGYPRPLITAVTKFIYKQGNAKTQWFGILGNMLQNLSKGKRTKALEAMLEHLEQKGFKDFFGDDIQVKLLLDTAKQRIVSDLEKDKAA